MMQDMEEAQGMGYGGAAAEPLFPVPSNDIQPDPGPNPSHPVKKKKIIKKIIRRKKIPDVGTPSAASGGGVGIGAPGGASGGGAPIGAPGAASGGLVPGMEMDIGVPGVAMDMGVPGMAMDMGVPAPPTPAEEGEVYYYVEEGEENNEPNQYDPESDWVRKRKRRSLSSFFYVPNGKQDIINKREAVEVLELLDPIGGPCSNDNDQTKQKSSSKNLTLLIEFYLNLLRMNCLPGFSERLQHLFEIQLITPDPGFIIRTNWSHLLL